MYDIPELEKKWRIYKRKQKRNPIIIGVSSLLVAGIAIFVATNYLGGNKGNNIAKNNAVKQQPSSVVNNTPQKESPAIIIKKTPIQTAQVQNSNTANTNSDDSIDLTTATTAKLNVPDEEIRVIGFDGKEKKNIKNKYKDIVVPAKTTQDIQELEEIKTYEERFRSSQDPKDSLYLAKFYYNKGNYEKAETWAVNTNNIDGDIEESWLIFAKARAKQGHRVDAIKVLQSYYEETGSTKAKDILDKLRRNKPFK